MRHCSRALELPGGQHSSLDRGDQDHKDYQWSHTWAGVHIFLCFKLSSNAFISFVYDTQMKLQT